MTVAKKAVFAGDQKSDLYDQRHRVGKHESAENHQEPGLVSERRGVAQTLLFGATKHQPEMDHADSRLESSADSLYY